MDDTINIVVASRRDDERQLICDALSEQINFYVIGIAGDETGAIIKTEYLKPHIIILDLQLSEAGFELIQIIRSRSPSTSIIIFFDNERDVIFDRPLNPVVFSRVSGFLLKKTDINKLAYIINIIFLGGSYINMTITINLINSIADAKNSVKKTERDIYSAAERNIIFYLARGLTDFEIAEELNFTIGTIRNFITELKQKTKMKSRVGIVIHSLVSGLIRMENL